MAQAYGEVIGTDTQVLSVESHRLYEAPRFGSFVRAECLGSEREFYAVVTRVSTGPFDSSRVVQAHGMAPGELEVRKPHLTTLLRTTFEARVVGYGQGEARVCGTPPLPPRLHCFVYPATPEEIRAVTTGPAFLRPLTQVPDVSPEDLLVSVLQQAAEAYPAGERAGQMVAWGKFLARLLRGDYITLESVLQRLSPGVPASTAALPRAAVRPHPVYEEKLPIAGNGSRAHRDPFQD